VSRGIRNRYLRVVAVAVAMLGVSLVAFACLGGHVDRATLAAMVMVCAAGSVIREHLGRLRKGASRSTPS
jgi:hypothetical protein